MSNLLACILACISVRDKNDEGIKKMCSITGGPSSLHERTDVTLACGRCCITNGYLQRFVWDVNGFS